MAAATSSSSSSLLDLINLVDNVPLDFAINHHPYYTLHLLPDPRTHGYIHPSILAKLPLPSSFTISHTDRTVSLCAPPSSSPTPTSPSSPAGSGLSAHANAAFQETVNEAVARRDDFPMLNGLHSEHFLVPGAREFVQIERFAASLFGIAMRGSHLTAYTWCTVKASSSASMRGSESRQLKIWVARRSAHLHSHPGKLDSTVAGGVRATDSPLTCILAEAVEEASLPASLIHSPALRQTGVITLANRNARSGCFHSEMLHTYDLEISEGLLSGDADDGDDDTGRGLFRPGDEEVEEFVLMSVEEVKRRMLDGEFKPNVCPVLIDFMIRHGLVTAENERDYVEICTRLRRTLPVPVRSDV